MRHDVRMCVRAPDSGWAPSTSPLFWGVVVGAARIERRRLDALLPPGIGKTSLRP